MLTVRDLRIKIQDVYRAHQNKWGWIAFWFPANNEAWIEDEDRDSELEYVRVTYSVTEDEVAIVNVQPVTLSVSVSELNDAMGARDESIMRANEKINELSAQIASLRPYKDAADKAEQERVEAETAEKRKQFKEKMLASKLFTEKEIEASEALKAMIEQLDELSLKSEIAERFMAKLDSEPVATEVAEASEAPQARVQVGEGDVDNKTFMRIFLGKN